MPPTYVRSWTRALHTRQAPQAQEYLVDAVSTSRQTKGWFHLSEARRVKRATEFFLRQGLFTRPPLLPHMPQRAQQVALLRHRDQQIELLYGAVSFVPVFLLMLAIGGSFRPTALAFIEENMFNLPGFFKAGGLLRWVWQNPRFPAKLWQYFIVLFVVGVVVYIKIVPL